jgi:hypothetical protein
VFIHTFTIAAIRSLVEALGLELARALGLALEVFIHTFTIAAIRKREGRCHVTCLRFACGYVRPQRAWAQTGFLEGF